MNEDSLMEVVIYDKNKEEVMPIGFNLNEGKSNHHPLYVYGISFDMKSFICGLELTSGINASKTLKGLELFIETIPPEYGIQLNKEGAGMESIILNGDYCYVCGEHIGNGGGFQRSCKDCKTKEV